MVLDIMCAHSWWQRACRLQQRQRLRERKESRQKEADAGGTLNRQELVRREAEALKNALALLEEEESESQHKAETARKQKAKKDRRKGDHLRFSVPVACLCRFCDFGDEEDGVHTADVICHTHHYWCCIPSIPLVIVCREGWRASCPR